MDKLEKRLTVFAKWLESHTEYGGGYEYEGAMEKAIRQSKEETIQQIGSWLTEILAMDNEHLENELK